MKLKNMPIEELELLSYTDLTYRLIKENKKPMNTPTVFREICDLLDYSDDDFASKIGDYYTSLTIDKRFVLLENNEWDIRDHHSVDLILDDDEEEDIVDTEEDVEDVVEVEEETERIDEVIDDEIMDEEELEDLSIVEEEELEE